MVFNDSTNGVSLPQLVVMSATHDAKNLPKQYYAQTEDQDSQSMDRSVSNDSLIRIDPNYGTTTERSSKRPMIDHRGHRLHQAMSNLRIQNSNSKSDIALAHQYMSRHDSNSSGEFSII